MEALASNLNEAGLSSEHHQWFVSEEVCEFNDALEEALESVKSRLVASSHVILEFQPLWQHLEALPESELDAREFVEAWDSFTTSLNETLSGTECRCFLLESTDFIHKISEDQKLIIEDRNRVLQQRMGCTATDLESSLLTDETCIQTTDIHVSIRLHGAHGVLASSIQAMTNHLSNLIADDAHGASIIDQQTIRHEIFTNFGIGVLDSSWLHHRLDLFESTLYQSLNNQTDTDFTLNLFIDEDHPEFFVNRIRRLAKGADFRLNIIKTQSVTSAANWVTGAFLREPAKDALLLSAMDDDDLIDSCAIETMKQESNRDSGTHKLLSLNSGLEIDMPRMRASLIFPESIKILLSIYTPPGSMAYSPTHYSHVTIGEILGRTIEYRRVRMTGRSWFAYIKHPMSDSSYYGSKYRMSKNPESFRLTENIPILTSLGVRDTDEMASVGRSLPDAMPYKTLARGHRSDLVPQSNWRIRRRVSRITRHRPDLNHRLNITFISSDYTQRVISKAMEGYLTEVTKITNFQVQDLDFKLREANPDIIFTDLVHITNCLDGELTTVLDTLDIMYQYADYVILHRYLDQEFESDVSWEAELEGNQAPVDVLGNPKSLKDDANVEKYARSIRRLLDNRFRYT